MRQIIRRKQYDTETALLIADDKFWDGHNMDRQGRSTSLYRTLKGNFFVFRETRWQGEFDNIEPVAWEAAKDLYEELAEQYVSWSEAFEEDPELA